jgi:hypothetical protein
LQRFWGASGDFWQSQWEKVLDAFGHNQFNVGFFGTFFVTFFVYWIVGTIYTLIDFTGRPAFLLKYKIQDPNAAYPVRVYPILTILPYPSCVPVFTNPLKIIIHFATKRCQRSKSLAFFGKC